MSNPFTPPGTLNKLLGSLSVVSNPGLNIIFSNLGDDGISMAPETPASAYLPVLAAAVPSPNPFQIYAVVARILRTQPLAQAWENIRLSSTTIGDVVVTPDTTTLGPYRFTNCTFMNVDELGYAGKTPDYVIRLQGTYYINQSLFP